MDFLDTSIALSLAREFFWRYIAITAIREYALEFIKLQCN